MLWHVSCSGLLGGEDARSASTIRYALIRTRSWWEEIGRGHPVRRPSRRFSLGYLNGSTSGTFRKSRRTFAQPRATKRAKLVCRTRSGSWLWGESAKPRTELPQIGDSLRNGKLRRGLARRRSRSGPHRSHILPVDSALNSAGRSRRLTDWPLSCLPASCTGTVARRSAPDASGRVPGRRPESRGPVDRACGMPAVAAC